MKKAPRSIHVTYLRHTPKLPVVGDKGASSKVVSQFKLPQNVGVQRKKIQKKRAGSHRGRPVGATLAVALMLQIAIALVTQKKHASGHRREGDRKGRPYQPIPHAKKNAPW